MKLRAMIAAVTGLLWAAAANGQAPSDHTRELLGSTGGMGMLIEMAASMSQDGPSPSARSCGKDLRVRLLTVSADIDRVVASIRWWGDELDEQRLLDAKKTTQDSVQTAGQTVDQTLATVSNMAVSCKSKAFRGLAEIVDRELKRAAAELALTKADSQRQ